MIKKFAFALVTSALVAGAHAGTVVASADLSFLGELDTSQRIGGSASSSIAGPADLTFALNGYNSLDGANSYMDIFTLKIDGATVFSGTFNLGGGGDDVVFQTTSGLVWSRGTTAAGTSGTIDFFVPFTLVDGVNSVEFSYDSPTSYTSPANVTYSGLAGHQGTGDEGWGLGQLTVTAVPEPGSIALMLAGLGILGGLARRRRQA